MPELIISPEAEADLIEIWLYIAEDSPVNADRFLDKLNDKAQKLAETDLGVERPELGEGMKSFPVDRYVLYYRPIDNGAELVRVLVSSRDTRLVF
ncbi:MAG: plasmid stabilization protein [Pseudomonadales bacterium]|jgi:toxin ParE1/3/4|nr:plasmid stabilization protein [Pseudomonadales bacterium]HAG96059.1 type II toxin-antitoxin system RelE/ParE family toxin [Gammaproteobacteria bacterium]HAU13057.1 type II toxin-antitoxin system RelE/ParE family toxin [Gammaproteobacteria bacterium]|tara:strand:+ start:1266 stop:1550 length:285 start_codon:yes stop_codon:yes gene_type:complete